MARPQDVEILIHINAPSRASDDARYRSLAAAYINFQPETRSRLSGPTTTAQPWETRTANNNGRQKGQNASQVLVPNSLVSGHSQPFPSLRSPDASFRSVLDNANSPLPPRKTLRFSQAVHLESQASDAQLSWQSPPSVVQDSFTDVRPSVSSIYASPTRVLEHYLQQFDESQSTRSPSHISGSIVVANTTTKESSGAPTQQSSEEHSAASVIPCTPSTPQHVRKSAPTAGDRGGQSSEEEEDIIDETILLSPPKTAAVDRADSEPLPDGRPITATLGQSPLPLIRSESDIGPSAYNRRFHHVKTVPFLPEHGYTFESLEVRAPEPEVSMAQLQPQDLVTTYLAKLAQDLEIPKRFRPQEQRRSLRPTERGFWLLDCTTWDAQLQYNAWAYLANYIGQGKAGWGVWCKRDADFRWLRVYCWGAIVPHIFLLIYLASLREVLSTGCEWFDGEGNVTIVMAARRSTSRKLELGD